MKESKKIAHELFENLTPEEMADRKIVEEQCKKLVDGGNFNG